jgi:hypothetical protein
MQAGRIARIVFGVNALVVAVGVVVQLFVTADLEGGFFDSSLKRTLNVFVFFTIQSNILVGIGTGMLALGRARPTTWFRAVRLTGLVGIALTFIVFHAVLRDLQDLTGNAALADFLLHTVSPVLCVGGWLWFGPRGQTSATVVWWSLAFLLAWGTFTLIRGHIIEWYPYPFMDPIDSGYVRVVVNLVIVGAVFIGMAAGAHLLDRKLPERDS